MELTIADEISPGSLSEASMLISHVLEHDTDLDGFHALEGQVRTAWMPQALACVAAYLVGELAEALNKNRPDPEKLTPEQELTGAISMMLRIQDDRNANLTQ